MKNKPIIIVSGEPKSIFLEIFLKAFKKRKYKSPIILICCKKIFINEIGDNFFRKKINVLDKQRLKDIKIYKDKLNLIDIECKKINNKFTKKFTKLYLVKSFDLAIKLIRVNLSNKLINGPINKKTFLNKKTPGITEYISNKCKIKKTGMLIYNKKLSVSPITTHIPLKLVANKITKKLIEEKIQIIDLFYKTKLKIKPMIGVAGLNPHCESFLKFNEDFKIVEKAIQSQKRNGINVSGPHPSDTIFLKNNRKNFNIIIGMYHDQVLTPIKTIFEFNAINITMGLPFLRITPDHGPNEKMIGKNISNPQSLINALNFADKF